MKLLNKLGIATAVVVLGFGGMQTQANAASFKEVEQIINGEFELFNKKDDKKWYALEQTNVPGWQDNIASHKIELWTQGFSTYKNRKSPTIGSDGEETGHHLELNHNGTDKGKDAEDKGTIVQTFTLSNNLFDTAATFSFDAWKRTTDTKGGTVSVTGSKSGDLLLNENILTFQENKWKRNDFDFQVIAGEEITVSFTADEYNSVHTLHIDQVSFKVREEVPEPTSMLGILAVGAFGTASTLKRRKEKEA